MVWRWGSFSQFCIPGYIIDMKNCLVSINNTTHLYLYTCTCIYTQWQQPTTVTLLERREMAKEMIPLSRCLVSHWKKKRKVGREVLKMVTWCSIYIYTLNMCVSLSVVVKRMQVVS